MLQKQIVVLFTLQYIQSCRGGRALSKEYRVDEYELQSCCCSVIVRLLYNHSKKSAVLALCLHSQAIDEQVERQESPCDTMDRSATLERGDADTHAEVLLHTSASFHCTASHDRLVTSTMFPASCRCARQLSSGSSQRNFTQLLMRYWQIPFQQ